MDLQGGINTYTYVGNNPLRYTDPLGLAPGDSFSSPNAAAIDALNWVYSSYPKDPKEYAGTIYQNVNDQQWYATVPIRSPSIDESRPSYPPFSAGTASAYYHTHGQCTNDHVEDDYSRPSRGQLQSDTYQSWLSQMPSYLGTPGGYVLRFDPSPLPSAPGSGSVTTLQNGTCCSGESYRK